MRYPVEIEQNGNVFMARFPDIPEALASGDTAEDALQMAQDALVAAMTFYFEYRRTVPLPSKDSLLPTVALLPSLSAKILLLNAMIKAGVSNAELARRMGTRPQEVNRIVDLGHTTKIDTIAEALAACGCELDVVTRQMPVMALHAAQGVVESCIFPPKRTI